MNIYKKIYDKLCKNGKNLKEHYAPKSNIHKHHIRPKHAGGLDKNSNFTYLTVREHIIAHFLLWKIYQSPNDLRAMKMLGAELTPKQRSIVGKYCHENGIGFHSKKYQNNKQWHLDRAKKSSETQRKNKIGAFFDPELKKEIASKGGKEGVKTQRKNKIGAFFDPELKKEIASKGGQALKGLICVTNGKHRTRIKPELLNKYISEGYKKGFTLYDI